MDTEDRIYSEKWDAYLLKWKLRTLGLGVALAFCVLAIIPFLDGHSLHGHFEQGKYLIYVACTLLTLFVGSCVLTYNFWRYVRTLRSKITSGD